MTRADPLLTDDRWVGDEWDEVDVFEAGVVEKRPRRQLVLKWLTFLVASLLIIAVLVGGAVGWWYMNKVNPPGAPGAMVNFTVTEADTLESVSIRLQEVGVITDSKVFRYYVRDKGGLELTPGYYEMHPGDHMGNIMRVLNTSPAATYKKVTFPEGYTLAQIGQRVERDLAPLTASGFEQALASGTVRSLYQPPFSPSLEGLLFPDTYQVAGNESEAQVISRMVALMERVGRQEDIDKKAAVLGLTPYQVLIVASMIEREARFDEDRPKIARVIYNRLEDNFLLQIDATLRYQQPPDTDFAVLKANDTPYNTYLYPGLPPTPIASPSRASIVAALNPALNPSLGDPICRGLPQDVICRYYYYVVTDNDGHHTFAATLEQHEANIAASRAAGVG
jgi:UPF0755 protein